MLVLQPRAPVHRCAARPPHLPTREVVHHEHRVAGVQVVRRHCKAAYAAAHVPELQRHCPASQRERGAVEVDANGGTVRPGEI
jgi:hypothetical protein